MCTPLTYIRKNHSVRSIQAVKLRTYSIESSIQLESYSPRCIFLNAYIAFSKPNFKAKQLYGLIAAPYGSMYRTNPPTPVPPSQYKGCRTISLFMDHRRKTSEMELDCPSLRPWFCANRDRTSSCRKTFVGTRNNSRNKNVTFYAAPYHRFQQNRKPVTPFHINPSTYFSSD